MNPILLDYIKDSVVLIRVGFDIPNLSDLSRIQDAMETIKLLINKNNTLILATKWGKIKTKEDRSNFSTKILLEPLAQILQQNGVQTNISWFDQYDGDQKSRQQLMSKNGIILFENLHFIPEENSKDPGQRLTTAKNYAVDMDFFVDECFISSHRQEATNTEIKELLPFAYGIAYQREVKNLSLVKDNPALPFVVIMGGGKLETKLDLFKKMLPKSTKILCGGLLCFTLIEAQRQINEEQKKIQSNLPLIFDSLVETDFLNQAKDLLKEFGDKIILPLDLLYEEVFDTASNTKKVYARDVGPNTVQLFEQILRDSKTVFWNGPLGFFEKTPYNQATLEIAIYLCDLKNSFRVLGGGDTNAALGEKLLSQYNFVSMAGGAALDFLAK